ncbi:MAG: GGDEF domain-containing protein [endosymbiont of Galathealinum brachiosum]|uniref:diguanylate cyclase n=1 Tax=endosymbiont of Galathealinum brachiosum TaxID=2200906 RepID=A0A370DK14_9GAMM|nr:MAG: GGDEF domain-containing protein [endosymbiont of Galathealinum brachiosum]
MKLFLCFILVCIIHPVQASQTPLDLSTPQHNIGQSMIVYEDIDAGMNFEQIRLLTNDDFYRLKQSIFSTPFSQSAYWFKLSLNNTETSAVTRLIVFEPPWLDHINISIISPGGNIKQIELGNTFNYEKRGIDHSLINFKHMFEPGESIVFMQVKTRDPFVFAVSILAERDFLFEQMRESKKTGFLYGVMIALLLYNLFLYIGIKENYYSYYVLFVSAFLIMNASYNGYTFKLLFSQIPVLQTWIQSFSIILFSLTGLLFAQSFLNLKKFHPQLNTLTKNIIIGYAVVAVFSAVLSGYTLNVIIAVSFAGFISAYIFSIALYSWKSGNRSARFFIMGSASGLIGTIVTSSSVMGIIPFSYITYKALDFGMLIDAVFLSLALADRVRITNNDKLKAEQASLTDVLTGLKNRRSYYETRTQELHRIARYKNKLSMITLDVDQFKHFNDNFGHDVGDQVLKHLATILEKSKRQDDYVFRMGGDEFLLLLPETDKEEASQLAERIATTLENERLIINDTIHRVHISSGVAEFLPDDTSMKSVEKRADIALYEAKEST